MRRATFGCFAPEWRVPGSEYGAGILRSIYGRTFHGAVAHLDHLGRWLFHGRVFHVLKGS